MFTHLIHNCAVLLFVAAVLHQGFATVAPPTTAHATASPHKDPGRPEKINYFVNNTKGTCLMASMGIQLNVTFSSVSQNKVTQTLHKKIQTHEPV